MQDLIIVPCIRSDPMLTQPFPKEQDILLKEVMQPEVIPRVMEGKTYL